MLYPSSTTSKTPEHLALIEEKLREITESAVCTGLQQPSAYALLGGGKRFRPILTLLTAEMLGSNAQNALPIACAAEMVHAASLLLDDLPCMDDARTRRSRPTCHRVFGESLTILTAVNLLNGAYSITAEYAAYEEKLPGLVSRLLQALQSSIGCAGLIGGQMEDLRSSDQAPSYDVLTKVYERKTASLFSFAAVSGALVAGASETEVTCVQEFARHLGMAYQLLDDVLDITSTTDATKDVGKDTGKCTFLYITDLRSTTYAVEEIINHSEYLLSRFGSRNLPLLQFVRRVLCAAPM